VQTSHTHIWNPERVATELIKMYQSHGSAEIHLNGEGPCADSVGLYRLLDFVCDTFEFDRRKITIWTWNAEELHDHYVIKLCNNHWFPSFVSAAQHTRFIPDKTTATNLLGCLYNIPSWERLCLLSYVHRTSTQPNILACNGTWEPHRYNTYYLNTVADYCAAEFNNIADYLRTGPLPLTPLATKPVTGEHMAEILPVYNSFYVDLVSETYTNGLSFFPTEKTLRPMYALTPFIIYGPQGFVDNLRSRYGFQSFSNFWDESYDNLQNYKRVQAIYQVVDHLNTLSAAQQADMYAQMMPILQHNRQRLLELVNQHDKLK
jgi:hypothetical protein